MPKANHYKKAVQAYFASDNLSFQDSSRRLRDEYKEKFNQDPGNLGSYDKQLEVINQLRSGVQSSITNPAKEHQKHSQYLVDKYGQITGMSVPYPQSKEQQQELEYKIVHLEKQK